MMRLGLLMSQNVLMGERGKAFYFDDWSQNTYLIGAMNMI